MKLLHAHFDRIQDITTTVKNNQVLVISGETGCGKTTQVPQFLLENEVSRGNGSVTRIVVTQPRRISAISVAERVAAERGESIGNSIGYQVQLERQYPRRIPGSIMYVTTGMLLQWLHSDPLLEVVTLDTTGINVAHIREVIALSKKAGLGLQPSTSDEVSFLSSTSLNEDLEEFREATTHDLESYADKGDQIRTYLLDQLSTNSDPAVPLKKLLVRRVELDAEMQRELQSKQLSCSYTHMLKTRSKLPAFDLRNVRI
ncbi:hypothetical protein AHF37_03803 [Paragonimus kellicotti]|nr:hypothetical protein AHF37_03803 [Paragonimus kellicotti]